MAYTRSDMQELGLGQLSDLDIDRAITAFNGFSGEFGEKWIQDYFQRARSTAFVHELIELWDNWILIRPLPGSEEIEHRWSSGVRASGVSAELRIVAHLLRNHADIELFTPIQSHRVPDCRFRPRTSEGWTYAEISQRAISELVRQCENILSRVSQAAGEAMPGLQRCVAILRIPNDTELASLLSWISARKMPEESFMEDLAVFYAKPLGEAAVGADERLNYLLPQPRRFATNIRAGDHGATQRVGTAGIRITDQAAAEVLNGEAKQLPKDSPGIVCLDVSNVPGGLSLWTPLIRRRFQPRINTRISGVLLFSTVLRTMEKPYTGGTLLINEHAARPLSDEVRQMLRTFPEPPPESY